MPTTEILTHRIDLSIGMAGIICDNYGTPEESSVNGGLAAILGLDGDANSYFDDHSCVDDSRRRSLLSGSVAVGTTATITSSQNLESLTAAVSSALSAAASSGALTSAIQAAAADLGITSMASVGATGVTAAAEATDAPTPVPVPAPTAKPVAVVPTLPAPTADPDGELAGALRLSPSFGTLLAIGVCVASCVASCV